MAATETVRQRGEPAADAGEPMALRVRDVAVRYGNVQAVRGVSLAVPAGRIHAVIGPNGAGKTSLLRAIAGLVPCRSGTVLLADQDVTRTRTELRARRGLTLVPEGRGMFSSMSVEDNLLVAGRGRRDSAAAVDRSFEMFPLLTPLRHRRAGLLSGGEQQILALARALMLAPKVLLLDEPSMGLAPVAVTGLMAALSELGSAGPGVLLIEQNARVALELAGYVYVMQHGRVVKEGRREEISNEESIARLYFGG
jgi:branched-chain amino acid transport system ATP-binding protein